MDIEDIKIEIKSKVTGDLNADAPYFRELKDKYDHKPGYEELNEWIDELVAKEFIESLKMELGQIERDAYRDAITRSQYYRQEHQYDKAVSVMRKITRQFSKYVNDNDLHDYGETVYCDFSEDFERSLYLLYHRTGKVKPMDDAPAVDMYLEYFEVLFAKGEYAEANKVLAKAKRWNPVCFQVAYYEAELCKLEGDLEQFLEKTKEAFRYAYQSVDVALLQCNLGYYFLEKELYEEAWYCYDHAFVYDRHCEIADKGLDMIEVLTEGKVKDLEGDRIAEISKQYDVPYGYDEMIYALSYQMGKYYLEQKQDIDMADYYLTIGYDLSEDDDFLEMIDIIDKAKGRE